MGGGRNDELRNERAREIFKVNYLVLFDLSHATGAIGATYPNIQISRACSVDFCSLVPRSLLMARTKQTGRKSTGGSAPRLALDRGTPLKTIASGTSASTGSSISSTAGNASNDGNDVSKPPSS